jgi:hypothetical protein
MKLTLHIIFMNSSGSWQNSELRSHSEADSTVLLDAGITCVRRLLVPEVSLK